MKNPLGRDISHIQMTALVAVVALIGGGVWQAVQLIEHKSAATSFVAAPDAVSTSSATAQIQALDPISAVSYNAVGELENAYVRLQQTGAYSSSTATDVASSIGMGLQAPISYPVMVASQVNTGSDTSYNGMMTYRAGLQTSMKPLLSNTEPEYEIFGMYVQTQDPKYLAQLREVALNYEEAASSTMLVETPPDAITIQLGLVNSLNEFAAVLNALADHAGDPIASTVLLENYNKAENDVLTAFQALVTYEKNKTQ